MGRASFFYFPEVSLAFDVCVKTEISLEHRVFSFCRDSFFLKTHSYPGAAPASHF